MRRNHSSLSPDRSFGEPLLCDVGQDDHDTVDLARRRIDPRNIVGLGGEHAARGMLERRREQLAFPGQGRAEHFFPVGESSFTEHLAHVLSDHLAARPFEPFGEGLVHEAIAKVPIDEGRHDRDEIGEGKQARAGEHR